MPSRFSDGIFAGEPVLGKRFVHQNEMWPITAIGDGELATADDARADPGLEIAVADVHHARGRRIFTSPRDVTGRHEAVALAVAAEMERLSLRQLKSRPATVRARSITA